MKDELKDIYRVNLQARPGEKALVFTDLIAPDETPGTVERGRREGLVEVARAARDAGVELGLEVRYAEFTALGSHGTEPDEALWRLAFGDAAVDGLVSAGVLTRIRGKGAKEADVEMARAIVAGHVPDAVSLVIALSNYSTSHTRFRDLLTSVAGARYASMPLFERDMLDGSMRADWGDVERRCNAIIKAMEGARSVRITTAEGTDITFSIEGRAALGDTGILAEPGSFSNLPAGEVYFAPVEGTAEGVLALVWAPNRKLESVLRVVVKGGLVQDVEGDEPFREELMANLGKRPENRNIAELGIGANDMARRPDNILESEKILGTVHIAFGDNSSMGGRVSTPFHQDFVFFGPTMTVDVHGAGRTIISAGRLLV